MSRRLLVAAGGFLLAGCGSGGYTTTPPTTISGVGVRTSGPPPRPSTPGACVRRWNGSANADGRAAARRDAAHATAAFVRAAPRSGYFGDFAGRCLVYVVARPSAVVFVEAAPGEFRFTAYATGGVSPNADFARGGRLRLR